MRDFGEFRLEILPAGPLMTNTYLLSSGGDSIIIDSGASHREIIEKLKIGGKKVRSFVMTHGHFDHIFEAMDFRKELGCSLMIGSGDEQIMEWSYSVSERYMGKAIEPIGIDRFLRDGDSIALGDSEVRAISLPGHTKGSIGLIAGPLFFTGDVLFRGTIGRTDIGGSMDDMEKSLGKISALDENLLVFSGHGPETTLKRELEKNPFLNGIR